jgi:hypothetical protein
VTPSGDGRWAIHKPGTTRASSIHERQSEAVARAHEALVNTGGGELRIAGRNGQIREANTVAPGNDPHPPKDKK